MTYICYICSDNFPTVERLACHLHNLHNLSDDSADLHLECRQPDCTQAQAYYATFKYFCRHLRTRHPITDSVFADATPPANVAAVPLANFPAIPPANFHIIPDSPRELSDTEDNHSNDHNELSVPDVVSTVESHIASLIAALKSKPGVSQTTVNLVFNSIGKLFDNAIAPCLDKLETHEPNQAAGLTDGIRNCINKFSSECRQRKYFIDKYVAETYGNVALYHDGCFIDNEGTFTGIWTDDKKAVFNVRKLAKTSPGKFRKNPTSDTVTPKNACPSSSQPVHETPSPASQETASQSITPSATGRKRTCEILSPLKGPRPTSKTAKPGDSAEVMSGLVEAIVSESARGEAILKAYKEQHPTPGKPKKLSKGDTRYVLDQVCKNILKNHGEYPAVSVNHNFAIGVVTLFDHLKVSGTHDCQFIYNPDKYTGKLEWRWKSLVSSIRPDSKPNPPPKSAHHVRGASIPSPVARVQDGLQESDTDEEDDTANQLARDLMWLKLNTGRDKTAEIVQRMRATLKHRRSLMRDGDNAGKPLTAGDIIDTYPRFEDTLGLIDQDFVAVCPGKENCLTENFSLITDKTLEIAAERAAEPNVQGKSLANCLSQIEERKIKSEPFDDLVFYLLVIMLPPTAFASERGTKVTADKAFPMLLDYAKDNTDVEFLLEERAGRYKGRRSPYLLLLGNPGGPTTNFLVVDHRCLQTYGNIVKAMDDLFKVHYVFGLEYQVQLRQFFQFLQTGVFGLDKDDCTPTVMHFRKSFEDIIGN